MKGGKRDTIKRGTETQGEGEETGGKQGEKEL
jgi:hypothetical protein